MIGIYKITSPSNRIYIGQSLDIENRFSDYSKLKCKAQPRIYSSLKKYGFDLHILEVIEECEINVLNERERYWQEFFNCIGEKGLNCQLVSTNELKKVHSEETKNKISIGLTGLKHTEESKIKI